MQVKTDEEKLLIVYKALQTNGYNARTQLEGYLQTGDDSYITRKNNARVVIAQIDKTKIRTFVDMLEKLENAIENEQSEILWRVK